MMMLTNDAILALLKRMFKEQIKQGAYPVNPQKLKEVIATISKACKIPENELAVLMKVMIKECSDESLAEPLDPHNANFIGAMVKVATANINVELESVG
jgi:hypothetical protein